jgi:hypothetical protein
VVGVATGAFAGAFAGGDGTQGGAADTAFFTLPAGQAAAFGWIALGGLWPGWPFPACLRAAASAASFFFWSSGSCW